MAEASADRVSNALGPAWPALRGITGRWVAEHGDRLRREWGYPVDDIELLNHELGVFLHDPADERPVVFDYDATPQDSHAFASTGVDGEHYSVLLADDCAGVVVLTAPMAFARPHVVVGASLVEALSLVSGGCGLAVPANLAYRSWDDTAPALVEAKESVLWAELRATLGLEAWPDVSDRLAQLRDDYLAFVQPRRR